MTASYLVYVSAYMHGKKKMFCDPGRGPPALCTAKPQGKKKNRKEEQHRNSQTRSFN